MGPGVSGNKSGGFPIGKYDEGLTDLADNVTLKKKATLSSKEDALQFAKDSNGSEFVVERDDPKKGLTYDVYNLTINDPDKKIHKLQDVKNLELFEKPLDIIEKNTGTSNSVKGFVVAENGDVGAPVYKNQFNRQRFDKIREFVADTREAMGYDHNAPWFWLVDTVMGSDMPPDNTPNIDSKELNNMKSHIKPGDIILNGNDGSFIHGIMYVGKDPKLQAQLEKEWKMAPGSLKDEGLIIHALVKDKPTEGEINGKKQIVQPSGSGVHVDTIERFLVRHPRDVMIAMSVKGASDSDRQSAIDAAKSFVGKKYDRSFNTYDDSEMYCTETVMKAWLNSNHPPKFETQRNPLVSYPQFVLDKLPEKVAKSMQDGGFLHQEMIMTDGIATSASTEMVWASQNSDKSVFAQKHNRWAEGMEGKINDDYKEMLMKDVPEQASKSRSMVNKINELAARTRQEVK
jgi:hypothetical protein